MGKVKNILLIEDDPGDQFFFREALKRISHCALYDIASNGQQALDKLRDAATLPDLIVTDVHMPVMDGIECLTEIVQDPAISHIPVIVLSSDTQEIERIRDIGARAFIQKPGDCLLLHTQLEQALSMELHTGGADFRIFISP